MKLKSFFFAGILTASLTVPALAGNAPTVEPMPEFSAADMQMLFEQDAMPIQLAVLSRQEMTETEGALLVGFVVGGGVSFVVYAVGNSYFAQPITWQGSLLAFGTGALTGGVGGALIRASGGGIAGNIAWRPNMFGANFGFSQYSNYKGW